MNQTTHLNSMLFLIRNVFINPYSKCCTQKLLQCRQFISCQQCTRCGPYFGITVKAVQCLTYQTGWNGWTCKKDKTYSVGVCGCVGGRISLRRRQVTCKVSKTVKKSLSYSFAVEMGHFNMVRWKYDTVCIFSMLRDTLELSLWKKTDKICKDQKRSIFSRRVLW